MPVVLTGNTPLGGVRSVAYWFDRSGREVEERDLSRIVRGEIHEYDEQDHRLGCTYVDIDARTSHPQEPAVSPFEDKPTWDIWVWDSGQVRHAVHLNELLDAMGWDGLDLDVQLREVSAFLQLPVWNVAPETLKSEVYAWLVTNRQE